MYKTIIIDDEPKCVDSIRFVLNKHCNQIQLVDTARSADEGFEKISQHQPDIVFLDVEMPYGNGFDLLNKFTEQNFEVIFVTAYENFAINAIKMNAVDYILKPFTEEDIIAAVNKAITRAQEKKLLNPNNLASKNNNKTVSGRIAVPTFEGLIFLSVNEIVRCEASDHYTSFYLADKQKILVCKNLAEYEEMLADFDFHRIHQSHLVNLVYIQKYIKGRGGYVVMKDGATLEVSARKKNSFLEKIFR